MPSPAVLLALGQLRASFEGFDVDGQYVRDQLANAGPLAFPRSENPSPSNTETLHDETINLHLRGARNSSVSG